MKTVNFFYTDNVSFKATNVTSIEDTGNFIEYTRDTMSEDGTIFGLDHRAILKVDLLYATVKDHATGQITIIPGLYDGFNITPAGPNVTRVNNILAEHAAIEERRTAKAAKERAKFEVREAARRAARKAEWVGDNAEAAPVAQPATAPASTAPSAVQQLKAAGLSDEDIAQLQQLNIVKN
ncbi:hypothetical protein DQT32_03250 [Salmonella enterica subsp. enterica serovar Braenderup]|nr:hypothetical protein [Salmonella enterica subsp. enterica serovar Braenderup]